MSQEWRFHLTGHDWALRQVATELADPALRQDPDVIMVGEIRDKETAQIAIEAALTGHLVLSTLHTNDAPGAVSRETPQACKPPKSLRSSGTSRPESASRPPSRAGPCQRTLQPKRVSINRAARSQSLTVRFTCSIRDEADIFYSLQEGLLPRPSESYGLNLS